MAAYDIRHFLPPANVKFLLCLAKCLSQFLCNILEGKMTILPKMKLLCLIFASVVLNYANSKDVIEERSRKHSNSFKFEDDLTPGDKDLLPEDNEARQYGLIYEDPNHPLRFPNENPPINQLNPEKQNKKRRRRRRKPKNQVIPNAGYPNQAVPNPGYSGYPTPGEAYLGRPDPYLSSGYQVPNGVKRPHRRPQKSSIASEAFSSILSALTSTALYDDKQCVPRMLCEAAGGGALGSSSLLQSVTGLQPLLTLLSAYNGITSSPLFVFGRAVFLGMTSKGNPGTCRYAYPYCPTDPEQLVHYLNNHNGGFFRFFNAPHLGRPQEQDLEQFYNHLSGHGYGFYQPNNPNQEYSSNQVYGSNQGYGLQGNLYENQNHYGYGYKFDERPGFKRVEERIQNRPNYTPIDTNYITDDDEGTKWRFPDDYDYNYHDNNLYTVNNKQPNRGSRILKFPDHNSDSTGYQQNHNYGDNDYNYRREKHVKFEDNQNDYRYQQDPRIDDNRYIPNNSHKYNQDIRNDDRYNYVSNYNNYYKYPKDTRVNNDDYEFDYIHNFYVKKSRKEEDLRTVYIVRGNGDPNHPEIVKVRPGESISK